MELKFECPHCGQHIAVVAESAGVITSCPSCQQEITIPMPPASHLAPPSVLVPPPVPIYSPVRTQPKFTEHLKYVGYGCGGMIILAAVLMLFTLAVSNFSGSTPDADSTLPKNASVQLKKTHAYWIELNKLTAEGAAIQQPDPQPFKEHKYDEYANGLFATASHWEDLSNRVRSLPTINVDTDLVRFGLREADLYGEASGNWYNRAKFAKTLEQYYIDHQSLAATFHGFVRLEAGEDPAAVLNEAKPDQERIENMNNELNRHEQEVGTHAVEMNSQRATLRNTLTQRYEVQF